MNGKTFERLAMQLCDMSDKRKLYAGLCTLDKKREEIILFKTNKIARYTGS